MYHNFRNVLILVLICFAPANATRWTPIVEWKGTHLNVINGSGAYNLQNVDDPVVDVAFDTPNAVVVWQEPDNNSFVVFVVDYGRNRVQFFDSDITRLLETETDITYNDPAGAGQFDSDELVLTNGGVVGGSESLSVGGISYTRVGDVSGRSATDPFYTIVYEGVAGTGGKLTLPTGALSSSSEFEIEYAYSSEVATDLEGDVDFLDAVAVVNGTVSGDPFEINQTIPSNEATKASRPTFYNLIAIDFNLNINASNDVADIFLLDSGLTGTSFPALHTYQVEDDAAAIFHYMDSYNCPMENPQDVSVAQSGTNTIAVPAFVWTAPGNDVPFTSVSVLNNALITNHTYRMTVIEEPRGGDDFKDFHLEISDVTTGNIIGYYGPVPDDPNEIDIQHFIPGLNVHMDDSGDDVDDIDPGDYCTFTFTTDSDINEFIFIADTDNDRLKVIKSPDNGVVTSNGSDSTYFADDSTRRDYYQIIGAGEDVPNLTYVSALRAMEDDFEVYTEDGAFVNWTRVDDFTGSGPADNHYTYNYNTQVLMFGDGANGAIPAEDDTVYAEYKPSLDILDYGTTGAETGQFSSPSGVAARWNPAQGHFDVYVSDTGNNRIAKLKFQPSGNGSSGTMTWVTSWTAAYTGSNLSGPTDLVVISDGQAAAADTVFLAVCDTGNDRIIVYRDSEAENEGGGGTTAPTFNTSFGQNGADFGEFGQPRGISAILNGTDVHFYVADESRDYVIKFEKTEYPQVVCDYSNISSYDYLDTGSYIFQKNPAWTYMQRNAPTDSFIKFYYSDTTTSGQATPTRCTNDSSLTTVTSREWTFTDTPAGTPANNSYYLYARLYDSNEILLDESKSTSLIVINSARTKGIGAYDRIDEDGYLLVQNGSTRLFNLTAFYPDSVAAVGFTGTFPQDDIQILSINEGSAWDGIAKTGTIFNSGFDNTAGTFTVSSAMRGSTVGIVSGDPAFVIAVVKVQVSSTAISTSSRFSTDSFSITDGDWYDFNNTPLSDPTLNSLSLKIAYLADIADAASSRGTIPNLIPNPDGIINTHDMVVFSQGWDGLNGQQDMISDIGPTSGTLPNLVSNPDGVINLLDLNAFATMFDWYQSQNFSISDPKEGDEQAHFRNNSEEKSIASSNPGEFVKVKTSMDDNNLKLDVFAENVYELMSLELSVFYDLEYHRIIDYSQGEFLYSQNGNFFRCYDKGTELRIYQSRLDRQKPGVSGSGVIAEIFFRRILDHDANMRVQYHLVDKTGMDIEIGTLNVFPEDLESPLAPKQFKLYASYPNPFNPVFTTPFELPEPGIVKFRLLDIQGREVFSSNKWFNTGSNTYAVDMNDLMLSNGTFLLQVDYATENKIQRVVFLK